jgi:glycogen(starch) synthase
VYDELVAPITLRAYDEIITLTDAEKRTMVGLGAPGGKVTVIPNGVEEENFEAPSTSAFISRFVLEGKRFVLYLGRINRTKGIEYLLRAFANIALEVPDCSLVIAGPSISPDETSYLEFLGTLARRLGISHRVVFTGRLSEEEKLSALEACHAFVLPSLYEPFGIVLLEAAAHSKPIVSAASDGPSSIIQSGVNGLLVRAGDPEELRDAMLRLLQDASLGQELGRNARAMAEGYRWSSIADRVEGVYEGLLARP